MQQVKIDISRLSVLYGNPHAQFAERGQALAKGQKVKVLPLDRLLDTILDGTVVTTVQARKRRTVVRVRVHGHTQFLALSKGDILVKW